jgi:PTH1 family peptidyl-tRNA hydrolase
MVLDELAKRVGSKFKTHPSRAQIIQGRISVGGPRVVLAKPMTYMNLSGGPVANLAKFFGIGVEDLIVVHDEIDIPFDTVKLKRGGGEGGEDVSAPAAR